MKLEENMQKFLVIDSIARSGTTLLSALLRTQDKCVTFDGSFVETELGRDCRKKLEIYKKDVFHMVGGAHSGPRLSMGLSAQQWKIILESLSSWDEIDKFYISLAKRFESDVIGFRWNECLPYATSWISRSPNHYWLAVVRDPRDRSVSNMSTHGWRFAACEALTASYGEGLDEWLRSPHKQFIVVYYEDLVADPQKSLSQIFEQIGYPLPFVKIEKLIGCDTELYRSQGFRVKNKRGDHKIGEKYSTIYNSSIGQYRNRLSAEQIKVLNNKIRDYNIYKPYRGEIIEE